ncbi:MAG: hypothetical protein WBN40_13185, partial [Pseudomonadales bacterium]
MKKIARLFHTLKFLKPTQLAFFVRRRLLPAARVSEASNSTAAQEFSLSKCIPVADENYAPYAFNFIGTIKKYSALSVDWRPDDVSRLWRYNLHYFDYLREPRRPVDEKNKLIENWIDSNPQGSQPGWEPFTASLRIVNWIIFASVSGSLSQRAQDSLYTQARWLFSNDERHILANHYFENLKAMLFAGCYF